MPACVFCWLGIRLSSSPPPHNKGELHETIRHPDDATVPRQITNAARPLYIFDSVDFFLLIPTKYIVLTILKEKKKTFIRFLLTTVFHLYWEMCVCHKPVQSIQVFTSSPCQRGHAADTMRDTSCACQSGRLHKKSTNKFHNNCCFDLTVRALTPPFSYPLVHTLIQILSYFLWDFLCLFSFFFFLLKLNFFITKLVFWRCKEPDRQEWVSYRNVRLRQADYL